MHPLDITPLQWAESAGAGIVAAIAVIAAMLYGVKKLLVAIGELKSQVDAVKKKASSASHAATSAASAATSAATSSQKIDDSLHTTNHGSHVRDEMDLLKKANVKMNEKLDIVIKNQAAQTEAMNTDRSAADMVHRELFRQVDEIRQAK